MEQTQIFEAVKQIVAKYMPRSDAPVALVPDATLQDLEIDSPRRVDILLDIEDRFQISISDSQFEKVRTVGDLFALVQGLAQPDA